MLEAQVETRKIFWEIFSKQNKLSFIDEFQKHMDKFAVNFNLYKDGNFIERSLPFDVIPRIIGSKEFNKINKGLSQRVNALNIFLEDIYKDKKILKDKIIPEEFIIQSRGYCKNLCNFTAPKNIRTHINGIDLVKDTVSNNWVVLEDNLRVPSGASYPLSIRDIYRKTYSDFFEELKVEPINNYSKLLEDSMNYVNCGGLNVVLTPGRYNSAYYEHAYLAKEMGAQLVKSSDVVVKNKILYFKNYNGSLIKIGSLYRRFDDEYLDPNYFNKESLIGISGVMDAYLSGNVAILNAPGNGVADDKGTYYFVPKMIEYYLNEKPILQNAPTYLSYYQNDKNYIFENMHKLVIKDVAESGGYGVIFGHKMTRIQLNDLKTIISANPRRFIAQELVEFYDEECYINDEIVPRKADFRAYIIMADEPKVWQCGLTRYATEADNYMVNSSQGGGFKDTWVMGA